MTDQIQDLVSEVPIGDLQIIRAALNSAYHYSAVIDLSEQYRKLSQRNNTSKLSQSLGVALDLVADYIERAHGDPAPADE